MKTILVNGIPETPVVFGPLVSALELDDVVLLAPPGFGAPIPKGFVGKCNAYAQWLIDEVEDLAGGEPVRLVGHSWGGLFVARLVSLRPELVECWISDAAGVLSPNFRWHGYALQWQTPREGEQYFARILEQSPQTRALGLRVFGIEPDLALELASALDQSMITALLGLYRSAVTEFGAWVDDFVDVGAPGLVIRALDDSFVDPDKTLDAAVRSGAELCDLAHQGHWWLAANPQVAAAVILEFFERVDRRRGDLQQSR